MVYVPPKYPNEIPTIEDLPNRQDDVHWMKAARYNELKKELRAALIELGTLPKGEYADVKARLDAVGVANKIIEGDSSVEVIDTNGDGHVDIKTENVLCGKYHSDGIHDLPKQSRCRAFLNVANQSIPFKTTTKVELNEKTYDEHNEFDPVTNYRFTATKAGYYLITGQVYYVSPTDRIVYRLYIFKNGSTVTESYFVASGTRPVTPAVFDIPYLYIGDYIELFTYHEGTTAKDIQYRERQTFMSIHKLS